MSKPDWAKAKLLRRYCIEDGEDGYRACSIPLYAVADLLRAERRRAVRACGKVKTCTVRNGTGGWPAGFVSACDDCARAIGGKQ